MTTTSTTTTTTTPGQLPALPAPPAFPAQAEGEYLSDYTRRALLYALQLPAGVSLAGLSDAALERLGYAAHDAICQRDISQTTLDCLIRLQADIRRSEALRRQLRAERDSRLAAFFAAAGQGQGPAPIVAPEASQTPGQGTQGGGQGGGGSKVPTAPRPTPRGPAGGLQAPPAVSRQLPALSPGALQF